LNRDDQIRVSAQDPVSRQQSQGLGKGLRNQKPIERIAMMERQLMHHRRVTSGNGKLSRRSAQWQLRILWRPRARWSISKKLTADRTFNPE
jgi:hypothetical protein